MHVAKEDVSMKTGIPGATARQKVDFGDAMNFGDISGEHFSLPAGMDISPPLMGLEGDMCQAPHWGYVMEEVITTIYADGSNEVRRANDLFYWPPGHTVKVEGNAEFVLFNPQNEHTHVMDHRIAKMTQ